LELKKIANRIVILESEKKINKSVLNIDEFTNVLIPCQDKSSVYCKKNKLLITANKLSELLEILASDILNPFKNKWLFNIIFADSIINIFKFIKRDNEHIEISIE
jgi:hypothetical protein